MAAHSLRLFFQSLGRSSPSSQQQQYQIHQGKRYMKKIEEYTRDDDDSGGGSSSSLSMIFQCWWIDHHHHHPLPSVSSNDLNRICPCRHPLSLFLQIPFSFKNLGSSLLSISRSFSFSFYLSYAYARSLRRATMTRRQCFSWVVLFFFVCVTQWLIYYAVSNQKGVCSWFLYCIAVVVKCVPPDYRSLVRARTQPHTIRYCKFFFFFVPFFFSRILARGTAAAAAVILQKTNIWQTHGAVQ